MYRISTPNMGGNIIRHLYLDGEIRFRIGEITRKGPHGWRARYTGPGCDQFALGGTFETVEDAAEALAAQHVLTVHVGV